MNATVNQKAINRSVATEHLRRIWAILAGEELTPEQYQLQNWWADLNRVQRRAFFTLAGINHGDTGKAWMELKPTHRALLLVVLDDFGQKVHRINNALRKVRFEAKAHIEQEYLKSLQPRVGKELAA